MVHSILIVALAATALSAVLVDASMCAARGLHQCTLTPEEIEGPYFILDDIIERSDIKEDRQGVPLAIDFVFQNAQTCEPVKDLIVHLWQADAMGVYSGFRDFHGSLNVERNKPTDNKRFLRGYQVTDAKGAVHFDTIMPGWYPGRCVHVHMETFLAAAAGAQNRTIHTTQGYFPMDLVRGLQDKPVYKDNLNPLTPNERDGVFVNENGDQLILDIQRVSSNLNKDGYKAKMVLGLTMPVGQ